MKVALPATHRPRRRSPLFVSAISIQAARDRWHAHGPALRDRVIAARERLAAANADNRRLYEALVPVVGSYCPGLAATPYHVHRYGARLE
jgi:hypothetical protein